MSDTPTATTLDKPVLGIALMLGFCVMAPMGDAMAKVLGGLVPLYALVLTRFAVQAGVLVPFVWAKGGFALTPRVLRLGWLRAALHIIGIGCMFSALRYLPIADAVAIAFVMPFIMLLLGWWVLGEHVGARRLIACAVGFVGTLLVVQPAFADVGLPALLPLVVAVVFALFMLVTRAIAKEVDPIGLQAANGLMAVSMLVLAAPVLFWADVPLWSATPPDWSTWAMLLGIGLLGTAAHLLMTWSLRFAPSATLAPMQYLEIPVATLIGLLVFGDLPNGLAAIGIVVTMAAGLYIILREQATARVRAKPEPPG
ncbi:DMT family transporter [Roseobacteraceae bacterium S113]